DMIIPISHLGYIKRTPLVEFRAQNRGGVGSKGSNTRSEDFIEHVYTASMHSYMLFFTRKGRCYWLKVYDLPEGAKNSKGRAIQNLLNIESDDCVNAFISVKGLDDPEFVNNHNLIFCTRNGIVKKTALEAYSRPRANGVNAILIREDDQLIAVELTDGNSEILMANRNGRAIRFHESKVRPMGRVSTGVRGMTLDGPEDEVVGMICMASDTTNNVLVVSENGYGKRTPLDIDIERPDGTVEHVAVYRVTNRGAKGVKTINITDKTGALVAIKSVNDSDDLIIINKSGITLRLRVKDIKRTLGRATQGVRLINLDKRGDQIASVCCVDTDPDEEVDTTVIAPQPQTVDEGEIDEITEEETDVEVDDIEDDVVDEESIE
ncbi:MAG: DNA gyrase subunit A, partial [Paramuribaculum sp.]|nr:DNA gyrase subunit A [Paramuribaculum sp.]